MVKLLMVDDDRMYAQEISREVVAPLEDVHARFAQDVQSALAAVESDPPDLILLDMIFPLTPADAAANRTCPDAGEKVIQSVTKQFPWIRIVILSGQEKDRAIHLLFEHRGITDYIFKDSPYDEIKVRILKQLEAIRCLKGQAAADGPRLVGSSPQMQALGRLIGKVAPESVTVLILGETGTGKEVVAHRIHALSRRRGGPFIKVNCSAFAASLLESELFGHRKGAFTGADTDRVGRFEAADGGTLFLDEIGDVSEQVQVKLLRFLQEREFEPVGSNRTVRVDVRLICATNCDLEQKVREGTFRQDFYHRIRVVPLTVPALADRASDLPELASHLLERLARQHGRAVPRLAPETLARLQACSWPGNVRELENVLARGMVLASGDAIGPEDLLLSEESTAAPDEPGELEPLPGPGRGPASLRELMARFERQILVRALEQTRFDVQSAAQLLGIDKRTMHNKLNLHRISRRRKHFDGE